MKASMYHSCARKLAIVDVNDTKLSPFLLEMFLGTQLLL